MSIPTCIIDIIMANGFREGDIEAVCRATQVAQNMAWGTFCPNRFEAAVAYAAQGVVGTEAERKRLEELGRIFNGEVYEPSRPLYNSAGECVQPAGEAWGRLEAERNDLEARVLAIVISKAVLSARAKQHRKTREARRLAKVLDARLPAASTQAPAIRARF